MTAGSRSKTNAPWSPEEKALLSKTYPTAANSRDLASLFPGRTLTAIKSAAKTQGILRTVEAHQRGYLTRPQSVARRTWDSVPKFDQFERLHGDYMISSDWHINKLDPDMLALKIKVAKRHGITKAVIVGDLFDQEEFSHWVMAGLEPAKIMFKDELVYAAQAFEDALAGFPGGIWLTSGNHDERILRVLRYSLGLSDVFSLIGRRLAEGLKRQFETKVKISAYPFCTINDSWYCCHPSCYSKIPCAVARDVAETEHMNTAMAGGHLWGLSKEKSGRYYCADLGCMCDPLKTRYKVMKVKRFPHWVRGFMMLKGGRPYLYDEAMARSE